MLSGLLARLRLDPRLSSMVAALIVISIVLNLMTGGLFLSPENLYNLSIQTCVIAVMACGMVYVIVARQIDLSVGSLLAFSGMAAAWVQTRGFPPGSTAGWIASIVVALLLGALVGTLQGALVAKMRIPAFIVTLAGYLMFRGAAFLVSDGQTLAPLHPTYQALGGGVNGAIGVVPSIGLGLLAAAWVAWHAWTGRRDQQRYGIEPAPVWVDALKVALMCGAIAGFVWVMCLAPDFTNVDAEGNPRGRGIGVPVLILIVIVVFMTFVAQRTRYGRYVFAYGGNPEAALLSGLPTTWLVWSLFILTGVLAAIAAVITTARLGSGANSIGQLAELYVISAAVIGGTSFAGGTGSVPGAVLGALLIQTLDNGMVLLDVSSPMRQIFIGIVLIVSVWFDVVYQKRS
ncbi:MAG: ABC transporter permease [Piscinibacter sp.]|uniref:sugar ABC transporter permease n=1 Tax=Piscinibacter sp. TaxID=1903157 RepID=UPI002585987D|nr:ABC transporter permease [Piscinibacter sp.]MCW5662688.1 ABC transporter permease [Piscinibacter sp.]